MQEDRFNNETVSSSQLHNDIDLIEACKRGCSKSQKSLYMKFKRKWYTICLRYMSSSDDAMDALQNALIKVFSKLDAYDNDLGTFSAWSNRIVINECLMLQRKNMKHPQIYDLNAAGIMPTTSKAIANLSLEEINKVIQELPTKARLVFNLFEIEGYGHEEIAEMLNISTGTSKSQLWNAKRILKRKLTASKEFAKMIS